MNEHDQTHLPDRLEQAADALRQTPVPAGPPAPVADAIIELLSSSQVLPDTVRRRERRKRMFRIAGFSGLAAAAASLAVLIGSLWFADRSASYAFGDVVEKVKDAKSVVFTFKQQIGPQPEFVFTWYVQGDHIRMEIPDQLVVIADMKQKKGIQLDLTRKTAMHQKIDEKVVQMFVSPVQQLRALPKDVKKVGEEKLDGRTLDLYEAEQIDLLGAKTKGDMKIWVDPKTQWPVRIQMSFNTRLGAKGKPYDTHFTLENFGWNQAIPEEMFRLEVPEGFTVIKKDP